jgi:hypothetical protein
VSEGVSNWMYKVCMYEYIHAETTTHSK